MRQQVIQIFTLSSALLLVGGFGISFSLLWVLIRSPLAGLFADAPNHRKVHHQVVPRLGGLAIVTVFLAGLAIMWQSTSLWPGLMPAMEPRLLGALALLAVFLLMVGTWDDILNIGFKKKFVLQFALAVTLVGFFEVGLREIHIFDLRFDLGPLHWVFNVLWLVGVMNAFNIIDGLDGLASGVSIIGFASLGALAHRAGAPDLLAICILLTAVTAGFMPHNFSTLRKSFLGDTGSLFLGCTLAVLSLEVTMRPAEQMTFLVPLFLVGYPLFDITVAMVRRFAVRLKGRLPGQRTGLRRRFMKMFVADNEHLHHRLVYCGLSHVQATSLLLLVAATMGASAVVMGQASLPVRLGIQIYVVMALLLILKRLGYAEKRFRRREIKPVGTQIVGVVEPTDLFYASLKGYKQERFEFLNIPSNMMQFFKEELAAYVVYNARIANFERDWGVALRLSEIQAGPILFITDRNHAKKLHQAKPDGYQVLQIHIAEKPSRIPDLLRRLEQMTNRLPVKTDDYSEPRFSLAEIALRMRMRHPESL